MELKSVFVTGANRGIGLELVRQLVNLPEPPKYVFATYRNKDQNQGLEDIKEVGQKTKVILIQMDITKGEDINAAAKVVENTVGEDGLTLLINNAGMAVMQSFPDLTPENFHLHIDTNTVGPTMMFQALLPLLLKASKAHPGTKMSVSKAAVLNISSMGGSIHDVYVKPKEWLFVTGYRASKAALNMTMRSAARAVEDDGILVLLMCPGHVKTDMGGHDRGEITVQESVSAMLKTISKMDGSSQGGFFDRFGTVIPF